MRGGCGVILFAAALGLSFSTVAAVYKWVDENGKTHYSDTPRDGARVITPRPNTENAVRFSAPPAAEADRQEQTADKIRVRILSPLDQQTLRDNSGNFKVTASVTPGKANIKYVLLIDGRAYGQPQKNGVFNPQGVDRGAHRLQVRAVDGQNTVLASSREITVYLHRFSNRFNK